MRVVKSGKLKRTLRAGRVIECRRCECEFEVESEDFNDFKFKLVSDWRDGSYYKIPCPECNHKNNVVASLF